MFRQRNSFGPWSSSLDSGTRLELSAFWRRRMAGLARLPLGRRVSRRWTAVGVIVGLLLGATPLVNFSPPAVADEEPTANEPKSKKVESENFVWKFSNGAEVELIGLAKNPSKDQPWWRPDGSPLPDASLPSARFQSDNDSREVAFRWRNLTDKKDVTRRWTTLPKYGGGGGAHKRQDGDGSFVEVEGLALADDAKELTVSVTLSVEASPWKTLFTFEGTPHAAAQSLNIEGKHRSVMLAPAYEADGRTVITATFNLEVDEARMVAIDREDKVHLASEASYLSVPGLVQGTFEFAKLPLDQVKQFELQMQSRRLETVEFRNVSLHADHATKVEVASSGERPRSDKNEKANAELKFGEVVERFVKDDNPDVGDFLIDFESGSVSSPPADLARDKIMEWVKANGIDAMGEMNSSVQGLLGFDVIAIPTTEANWDPSPGIFAQLDQGKPGTPAVMSGRGDLPATYHFQTREGTRGVLQIVEVVGREGVKIRYKLAKK